MANRLLTDVLLTPLDGAATAKVEIDTGSGNLTVDGLAEDEPVLASGTLEYFEKQGLPNHSVSSANGQATLTLSGARHGQPWFRLPWAACNGATEWHVHVNPVTSDLTVRTGGGNVKLNLAGVAAMHVAADSGGGNVEVVLPDRVANSRVTARTGGGNVSVAIGTDISGSNMVSATSGAGNVVVTVPRGLAARVHATSGLGKVTVEPQFGVTEPHTYQSADYNAAADKVDITVGSGAGNVSVTTTEAPTHPG